MHDPDPRYVRLGQVMRAVRDHLGLAQRTVAKRMGCTRQHLSAFENGRDLPIPATWHRWLAAVDATNPAGSDRDQQLHDLLQRAGKLYEQTQPHIASQQALIQPPHAEEAWPDASSVADPAGVIDEDPHVHRTTLPELAARTMGARLPPGAPQTRDAQPDQQVVLPGAEWSEEAFALLRQVEESDVGSGTLQAVDRAVHLLSCQYSSAPTELLRGQVGRYLAQVRRLLEGRLTLKQRRQLLVAAGWLALLGAALHFDVGDRLAATAMREVAFQLGRETDHAEVTAWSFETSAWFAVAEGRYGEAVDLARAGLEITAQGTSASVQLAVQEARAWARRGDKAEVNTAMDRATVALRKLPAPSDPRHHFVFDPAKLLFYVATCAARVGDAERGEEHAREVIAQSTGPSGQPRWPRRLVTARMDLGLALAQLDRPDEACAAGAAALGSGSVVASNLWQATELDARLLKGYPTLPEARGFHERYIGVRRFLDAAAFSR